MTAWARGRAAEGRFFPDTYTYAKGSSDWPCCAVRCMPWIAVWPMPGRARANTPLKSADEALILASIVEKETGRAETARRLPACSPTACA
jgi:UPF0755 protein